MITFQFISLQIAHLPLLFQWLALPHVAAWWRETRDWDKFREKYAQYINVPDVGPYIVCHDNKQIGYISWYDVAPADKEKIKIPIQPIPSFKPSKALKEVATQSDSEE